ncbi:hypothetical protein H9P43_005912 [Blastocladiella emersonii ATCC 22665]|nr:hypothetical protein H9P43_005912 [Blastocladiella emersonii ATCC 22665]
MSLLHAATLIVRRPLITATPSPLAAAYYKYHAALRSEHSRAVVDDFWTKKGAAGGDAAANIQMAVPAPRANPAADADVRSLDRHLDQSVYLVVKEGGKWGLVKGAAKDGEPLHEAARRIAAETAGGNMDLWMVGRVPVALSKVAAEKTFIHKAHILAGQAKPAAAGAEFAWVTKAEMPQYLDAAAYADVADLL